MRVTLKIAVILLLGVGVAVGPAFGQTAAPGASDPKTQRRLDQQAQRIDQGVQSGSLTPREAAKLEAEQARVRQALEQMQSDGNLTGPERRRLDKLQDRSNQEIYRQKHDAQGMPVDPRVEKRQQNQEERINQGVASGQLTPKEAGRLQADQVRIEQLKERMQSDGKLTSAERQRLNDLQDRAGQRINRQKNDPQKVRVE